MTYPSVRRPSVCLSVCLLQRISDAVPYRLVYPVKLQVRISVVRGYLYMQCSYTTYSPVFIVPLPLHVVYHHLFISCIHVNCPTYSTYTIPSSLFHCPSFSLFYVLRFSCSPLSSLPLAFLLALSCPLTTFPPPPSSSLLLLPTLSLPLPSPLPPSLLPSSFSPPPSLPLSPPLSLSSAHQSCSSTVRLSRSTT